MRAFALIELALSLLVSLAVATPVIYDGRAPFNLTEADLNASTDPYLTSVCLLPI